MNITELFKPFFGRWQSQENSHNFIFSDCKEISIINMAWAIYDPTIVEICKIYDFDIVWNQKQNFANYIPAVSKLC
ncbi:MAG: hypothetical protein IGS39_17735 [Calothrix sp. C42_A2020_038]|nr:hypothetical protein [Calothrix sp. C42_A2020_038]